MYRATTLPRIQRLIHAGEVARDLVAGIPGAALLVVDRDLELVLAEGDATSSRGHENSCGKRLADVLGGADWRELSPRYEAALAGEAQCFEHTAADDGSIHRVTIAPVRAGAETLGVLVLSQEITTPAREARLIAESERLLRSEIEALAEGVLVIDLAGQPLHANAAAREILGIGELAGEDANREWWVALGARRSDSGQALEVGKTVIASGVGVRDVQVEIDRRDGSSGFLSVNYAPLRGQDGQVDGLLLSFRDVTELRRARDHLQAVTDSVGEGLFTLDAAGCLTYMNAAAEEILGWSDAELRGRMMHKFMHTRRPDGSELPVEECPILTACGAGETIRSEADLFVRRDGRGVPVSYTAAPLLTADGVEGCVVVFQDISERRAREEALKREAQALVWIERIKEALAEDRFLLYAQPVIDLRTREVVQRELLLRMVGPDERVIAPGEFLPVAEKYGLIEEIDRWVIRRAIELAASGATIEINISAASIGKRRIIAHIERCLSESGVDPGLVIFEITETALIEDEDAGREFVQRLHALGCGIALDDFGTGYGGFTYLKQLPVDCLKIDVEFVRDLPTNSSSRHVVEAIIALAQAFAIKTVAEGVEDAQTLELLCALGVDFAQGYHIDGPSPFEGLAPPRVPHALPQARPSATRSAIAAPASRPSLDRGAQVRLEHVDDRAGVHTKSVADRR